MKVKLSIFIALLFCYSLAIAQIKNSAKTINQTFELAREKNKPLFLVIDVAPSKQFATKNVSFDKALEKDILEDFVYYQTNRLDTSIRKIILKNKFRSYPAFVFFHPNEDIFLSDFGLSSTRTKYVNMLKKAKELSKEKSITELQKDVYNNPSNNEELKKLIESRQKNGITDNAELIEQFAKNLEVKDLSDYQTVLFILKAGPLVDGMAYKLAYTNRKITDSIYKYESIETRSKINGNIISNTLKSAVKEKNYNRARLAANTSRNTSKSNYLKAQQNYDATMLYYYKNIKDTTSYFNASKLYYNNYFMKLSADSIHKLQEKIKGDQVNKIKNELMLNDNKRFVSKETMDSIKNNNPNVKTTTRTYTTTYLKTSDIYSSGLNDAAWEYYKTGTNNINHLTTAIIWTKRAIEIDKRFNYLNTLSHLLYKVSFYAEAEKTQEEAIELANLQKVNTDRLKETLQQIKNKTL